MALFGADGDLARVGALALAAVIVHYRPELPEVVLDIPEDESG